MPACGRSSRNYSVTALVDGQSSRGQLLLGLEEAEQIDAAGLEEKEQGSTALRQAQVAKRRTNRGSLPAHLPRVEI